MVSHLKVSVFYSTLDAFVGGTVLNSGSSGLVLSSNQGHCVVSLDKTLYTLSASLHPGVFSVFTSPWSELKVVTIQWIRSRIWDAIDDWYINNLAKNQVSTVFHSRVICRTVSPKFIELCLETPCLCPSEGHKHGSRKVTETSVTEFCYWNKKLLL